MTNTQFNIDEPDEADAEIAAAEFDDVLEAAPRLKLIRPFVASISRTDWFGHLGEAPTAEVRDSVRAYLDGLGFPDVEMAILPDWEDAAGAAASLDVDTQAWEAEEQIRAALTVEVVDLLGEEAFQVAMTHVAAEASGPIRSSVQEAAALWDEEDEGVINAAVGTAIQTCHLAALTLLSEALLEEDAGTVHPFAAKLALFEAGRWPVAITGSSFNLF